jgi:hypothetical protein
MDKNRVIQISDKIKKALSDISESEGIQISIGPISFSQTSFIAKITGVEVGSDFVDKSNLLMSKRYGFSQNIVGMQFESKFGKFIIDGFKSSNRKYPVLATRVNDGKQYKFEKDSILKYLGGNNIINRKSNLKNLLDGEE